MATRRLTWRPDRFAADLERFTPGMNWRQRAALLNCTEGSVRWLMTTPKMPTGRTLTAARKALGVDPWQRGWIVEVEEAAVEEASA